MEGWPLTQRVAARAAAVAVVVAAQDLQAQDLLAQVLEHLAHQSAPSII